MLARGGAETHTAWPMSNDAFKYLAIIAAVVAAVLISNFLVDFHDWNRTQTCVTAGGRNCGVYRH